MHFPCVRLAGWTAAALLSLPAAILGQGVPGIQSLNPDISVIGDFLADLSPEEPRVNEDGQRFSLREVELGLQAVVDPFFRADFFLALHGAELNAEEAYVTALSLPGELQARIGTMALPMGKTNLTHRPELPTPEYPLAIRSYFGPEGLSGTGVGMSRIMAPLGFFQELQLLVLNGIETEGHTHTGGTAENGDHQHEGEESELTLGGDPRKWTEQFAVLGHFRSYYDLSEATNVEVGFTAAAGTVERLEPAGSGNGLSEPSPDALRTYPAQRFYGANAVLRWRPPARALYRSFLWSAEWFGHDGPESLVWGGFSHTEWQAGRRTYLGARFDAVQAPGFQEATVFGQGSERRVYLDRFEGGEWGYAASGNITFFPSEFSRFRLTADRAWGEGLDAADEGWRAVFQATFSIGPHRPHAF